MPREGSARNGILLSRNTQNHGQEVKLRNSSALVALAGTLALLAGCGSSGSPYAASTGGSTATQAATSGVGGRYSSGYTAGGGSTTAGTTSAAATTQAASSSATAVVSEHNGTLGVILAAGPQRMTVYLFEGDKGASSSCSGACASAWPPVTSVSAPTAGAGVQASALGMITRSDGGKQVTYNGHPLYYFVQDKASGEASGQGVNAFGASWYVLSPSGAKVDKS